MDLKRVAFLARYYAANLIFSKIGGRAASRGIASSKSQWKAVQEANTGNSAWLIVGNGPSLNVTDLERLSIIPSIASNKINLLFERSIWRPALYTIVDALVLFKMPASHYEHFPLLLTNAPGFYLAKAKRKLPWRFVPAAEHDSWQAALIGAPDPIETGFLDGYTVTTANIQLAMWLGAKRIYLIGCDHFYKEDGSENIKKLAHGDGVANHFHPDYRKAGEIVNNAPVARMEEGYRRMRQLAERNGVRIINITRKTALTIFDTSSVEEALNAETSGKEPLKLEAKT